jgi:hypothetical protein
VFGGREKELGVQGEQPHLSRRRPKRGVLFAIGRPSQRRLGLERFLIIVALVAVAALLAICARLLGPDHEPVR